MMTEENVTENRTRGSIFVRIIGVLLLLIGGVSLFSAFGISLPFIHVSHDTYPLALWRVPGWVSHLLSGAFGAICLFAGVQLLRLRRSGWVAGTVILGYCAVVLIVFMATRGIERQVEDALRATGETDSSLIAIQMSLTAHEIERVYRIVWFFLVCHLVPFVYLISEWWRFWGKRGWYSSARTIYAKASIGFVVLALSGVWTFWGADYSFERAVLRKAQAAKPEFKADEVERLSLCGKRKLTAFLIRRLAAEPGDDLARAIRSTKIGGYDISLLEAEDIPAIIAAAQSPSIWTREICYEILWQAGTKEAEACLREAVNGPRDASWDEAVRSLANLGRSTVPDVLLQVAQEPTDGSRDNVLWNLASFDDPRVVPVLIEAMNDPDTLVRETALRGLGRCPTAESEKALLEGLQESDIRMRDRACRALAYIGTAESIPALIEVLRGPDHVYSEKGLIAASGAVHDSDNEHLHDDAVYALKRITGEDLGPSADEWEQWWREAEDTFCIEEKLRAQLFTPLPPAPKERLKSAEEIYANPFHRASVLQMRAIGEVKTRRMRSLAPELARYLTLADDQATSKVYAAEVLTRWGYREGIEQMIDQVDNDAFSGTRTFAIRALGRGSGVNFFSDKKRWRAWWLENRDRFPSALQPSP